MNDLTVIDNHTGEVLVPDVSTFEARQKSELEAAISMARKFPRNRLADIRKAIKELATMDETTAEEMRYALPRGKNKDGTAKVISGPSIRFAEMAAQFFGNCRVEAEITEINKKDKFVEAQGKFTDFQTNTIQTARVRRRIVDSRGNVYNDDMIMVTCNAAASIARRNAILAGIPKAIWNEGYEQAQFVLTGGVETLSNTRAKAIAAFTAFGLGEKEVLMLVDAESADDVGLDEVADLRSMYRQVKNKETTVEALMAVANGTAAAGAREPKALSNPMADDGPAPQKGAPEKAPAEPASALEVDGVTETAAETEKPAEDKPAARKRTTKPKEEAAPASEETAGPLPEGAKPEPTTAAPVETKEEATWSPPEPTTEAEYVAHARTWLSQAAGVSEITDRWKTERKLRNACNITSETLEELNAEREKRIAAL